MKNNLLLPYVFRWIGLVMLVAFIVLFIAYDQYEFQFSFLAFQPASGDFYSGSDGNYTNELIASGLLFSLIFIAFAKSRTEDEREQLIRLQSLHISHYLSYAVYFLILFSVNGLSFALTMLYVPYIFLVMFILVYYTRLYLLPKFAAHEKYN
jgi:hypothetical protein